jgi:hypothetical protein
MGKFAKEEKALHLKISALVKERILAGPKNCIISPKHWNTSIMFMTSFTVLLLGSGSEELQEEGLQEEGLQEEGLQEEGLQEEGLQEEGLQEEGLQEEGLQAES